jgi:DNA polymerase III subunit delta'
MEKRVSHALLFLGPPGSGNLAMAVAFARYLVCDHPGETDSCGICPACIKMEKLVHPDVTFTYPVASKGDIKKPRSVDYVVQWRAAFLDNPYMNYNDWMEGLELDNKQGWINVEESSDILNRLSLKSSEAGYKIVIIWLPERLNTHAANKLLKIIEEPPDDTLFFLVNENYEQLLPTIISRTQLVKINRLSDEEMFHAITEVHQIDKLHARRLVHRVDGDYNEALKLISENEESADLNQRFLNWMRNCLKLNVVVLNELSNDFGSESRESQKNFLNHALSVARECLLINYGDRSLVRMEGKDLEDIGKFAPFVNINNADDFIEELNKAHFHLERNANSKLLFTDLSLKMHTLLQVK